MSSSSQQVVFFDLVRALGVELAAWNGERMARFAAYPDVPAYLRGLGQNARLGLLVVDPDLESEDIERALARTGLDRLIDPSLHLLYRPEDSDPFARALREVGLEAAPERAVYVGSLAAHRERAHLAGMRVAPHLALASAVLEGRDLHYVRFVASAEEPGYSWAPVIQRLPAVPLLATEEPEPVLYAIAATSGISDLMRSMSFETLGSSQDVADTSLYLLQVTEEEFTASARLREFLKGLQSELPIVRETPAGRLIAVPGSRLVDEFHPPDVGPGHNRALLLSCVSLQEPAPRESLDEGGQPEPDLLGGGSASSSLDAAALAALAQVNAALIQQYLNVCLAAVSRHVKHPGNEQATASLAAALEQICGSDHTVLHNFGQVDGRNLYNIEGEIQGESSEAVIVGAHLDSTAPYPIPGSSSSSYNPAQDPAPGADDDASGVAGVLAAACVLKGLSQTALPKRTIRFLLFNAEEQGMLGSQAYAADLKAFNVPVAAMFQMDMIGWVSDPYPAVNGPFEVHGAGKGDYPSSYGSSNDLAQLVKTTAAEVSASLLPQIYPLPGKHHDPAAVRSDHASFHYHDWSACMVAEDLFPEAGQPTSIKPKNPAYHSPADSTVNESFAADVARAVAGAVWKVASFISADVPRRPGSRDATQPRGPTPSEPPATITTDGGGGPMPDNPSKFLVQFLAEWIVDPQLRCEVLHNEQTKLPQWGLTAQQRQALLTLDYQTILERIRQEFLSLGVDLDTAKGEIGGILVGGTGGGSSDALVVASTMYPGGEVHLRGVSPLAIAAGVQRNITLRGQGFDCNDTTEVKFVLDSTEVTGTVVGEIACDIDIYQRVTVDVKLDQTGYWVVKARNASDPSWSTGYVVLTVT